MSACTQKSGENNRGTITISDDGGTTVILKERAKRIVSLYSAHTENLFSLGLDREIVGVYKNDAYPPQVKTRKKCDYRQDPEEILALNPDLVLVRPFIEKGYPDFIKVLRQNNIAVVSLYPKSLEEFGEYMQKLGILTGREKEAEEISKCFYQRLSYIEEICAKTDKKEETFFESTAHNYRTVRSGSLPDRAIAFAGGHNIAEDATPLSKTSSLAAFGLENLIARGKEIDFYIAQKGAMNSAVSRDEIRSRRLFDTIKAVHEDRILVIDEEIISRPGLRYIEGVTAIAIFLHPSLKEELEKEPAK